MADDALRGRDAFLEEAEAFLAAGDDETALALAEARLLRMPGDLDARSVICRVRIRQGRLDEAEEMLREMEVSLASLSRVYATLGDAYHSRGMQETAETDYRKFMALNPDLPRSRGDCRGAPGVEPERTTAGDGDAAEVPSDFQTVTLAELYIRQGHLRPAAEVLEAILRKEPASREGRRAPRRGAGDDPPGGGAAAIPASSSTSFRDGSTISAGCAAMRHDPAPYAERLGRLRAGFPDAEALLILNEKNIRYLTGFTGGDGALMVGPDWLVLLVDGRYVTQARGEAVGAEIVEFRNRVDGIAAVARRHAVGRIGFESPALSVEEYLRLQERLPEVALGRSPGGFQSLRAVKDQAGDRPDPGGGADRRRGPRGGAGDDPAGRPGEGDRPRTRIPDAPRRGGTGRPSRRSSLRGPIRPFPMPRRGAVRSRTAIASWSTMVRSIEGYHSDETCTYIVGHASARQEEVYRLVREAHDRAIGAIRPGVSCGEIDRVARGCLEEAGMDRYFSHGTGHGVGLDVHEAPRLAAGREEILRPAWWLPSSRGSISPASGVSGSKIRFS